MDRIKNIGIFCKQKPSISEEVLKNLTSWLRKKNYEIFMAQETAEIIGEPPTCNREEILRRVDILIVLGGDGTLLSVARLTHPYDVPILAVNLGSLGFLTEVSLPELYEALERVLQGNFTLESRMLLNVCLRRDGEIAENYHVLNDVVINKGALARIVDLEVSVNNQYMTSYRADGLIVATPTGSTAYSLSAGGPIIHPSMNALVLCPICPFTLTNRPIVVPDHSLIQVKLNTPNEVLRITLDGQEGCDFQNEDLLEITKAETQIKLIQASGKNYYQILRKKLHWGRPADDQKHGKDQ